MVARSHQSEKNNMKLWLDDIRDPREHGALGYTWVKTADEAIRLLASGMVERASLDHDLSVDATMGNPAQGERTGYTVIRWMEENNTWPRGGVKVHSMNPVGRRRMLDVIAKHY